MKETEPVTRIQILDSVVSFRPDALGKGTNLTVHSQLCVNTNVFCFFLPIIWQPISEKENSEFKRTVLYLKIDLVLHAACGIT